MAESKLKITLETNVQKLKETQQKIIGKNSNAFSDTQLAQLQALHTRLQNMLQNFDPKNSKNLDSFNATISEVIDTLMKGAKTLSKTSPEFRKLSKELDKLKLKLEGKISSKQTLENQYNTEKNAYYDEYTKSRVKDKNIHYKAFNKQAVNLSNLRENIKTGASAFASEEDFKKAKELVEEITKEEQKTKETLDKLNTEIAEIESQVAKKSDDLLSEAKKSSPEVVDLLETGNTVDEQINKQKGENRKEKINEKRVQELKNAQAEMNGLTQAADKQTTSLGQAFKQFTLYSIALRGVKKALGEAKKTIRELDRALTEQAMVTGLTRKQTYGLLKDYQDMASRLGTTTKEVSSTMTQFLRQGRSINDSLKLTEAAVSAAKVAGISAADSINYLTTAINGFRLSADDAMKVSDKFAAVAATAATSYEEIAIALSKVAAQANLAGMSIDYTTALLTKGIETTREAPETIGTALKTVIARMREMTDYGETLEGDTNINNVEAQLSYIGIQLRDNNGELRSTEDVLNDLGGQWDTLNANQQAAIAKALAGTRQQSRLIAMMQDYERVIELQQVAERSQGATMAQMATYMEGMDAALNKVSVAWERIVSSIADSEIIIGIINTFSDLLEVVNGIVSNTFGMVALITTISLIGLSIFNRKVAEYTLAKQQNALELQRQKSQLKTKKILADAYLTSQKETLEKKKQLLNEKNQTIEEIRQTIEKKKQSKEDFTQEQTLLNQAIIERDKLETDIEQHENAQFISSTYEQQNSLLEAQEGLLGGIGSAIQSLTTPLFMVITLWKVIIGLGKIFRTQEKKHHKQTMAEQAQENVAKSMGGAAKIISDLGVWGIPIAIAVVAALIGATLGISAAVNNAKKNSFAGQVDSINQLSKEIFDLNKKSQSLDNVINKFEDLDNKVLKTNKDLEEMHDLLESAGDSLSDEEKDFFEHLETDQAKKQYLESVKATTDAQLTASRLSQREKILNLRNRGGSNWNNFLISNDSEVIQARDAMYALNNAYLYQQIDSLNIDKERAKVIEGITQNMLAQLKAEKAASLLANQSQIDTYIETLAGHSDAAAILASEDNTIKERVNAFKELHKAMAGLGDDAILEAFDTVNKEWSMFAEFSNDALDYMDHLGANIDGINELAKAIQKTGVNAEMSAQMIGALFEELEHGSDLASTITDLFGSENFDAILNAYDKAFGTTILNMGQNVDKFRNTVNSFYEKSKEWSSMSETDKTSFLSENAELFKGDTGAALLAAFENGNYAEIEAALANNEALIKQREQLLKDVNRQLEIEMARSAEERDNAYIKELEEYKRQLEDLDSVYLASLKMRYEQQQTQLDKYKEYLQKESEALQDSLNKRKDAYQKYFDAINQEEEREEYEDKANTLIANISKLSSSTNADAIAKTADLTKQLEDLEKERLKELRQQAQEAVIKGIEDEVTKISDNLEKLLNNEQALLNAMTNDASNPQQMIASMLSAQFASGNNTELGMQSYLQEMQSTFAAIMPGVDWSQVDVERSGDSLVLNILGKEITLTDGEQQTIYDAIQSALKQLGYN